MKLTDDDFVLVPDDLVVTIGAWLKTHPIGHLFGLRTTWSVHGERFGRAVVA